MTRNILRCDMNNFYASVECILDPALREHPVAVCGSVEERHGIVLAQNYKVKTFDMKTGDAVWRTKQKCKSMTIRGSSVKNLLTSRMKGTTIKTDVTK